MGAYKDPIWLPEMQDPYCYEQSSVLKNRLGIRDDKELSQAEADITGPRLDGLSSNPVKATYDFSHLKEIHRRIFQDVYGWAGQPRTVDMSKGGSMFARHGMLESFLSGVFKTLNVERFEWGNPGKLPVIEGLAAVLADVNAAHPFREGNGRTQRIFISQLAKAHGLKIDWSICSPGEMREASIDSFNSKNAALISLLQRSASKVKSS